MEEMKYRPLEKIVIEKPNEVLDLVRDIMKGRPYVDTFRTSLEQLVQMLGIKIAETLAPARLVELMQLQLTAVPYCQFPISFSTVDMIGVTHKLIDGKRRPFVLLGRRSENHLWQFPGGFRDPSERNVDAAKREYLEETCLDLPIERFRFVDDMFIDDRRYRDTPHKITTHIFIVKVLAKEARKAKGNDDIFEVKWFDIEELRRNRDGIVRDVHTNIFNLIEKHVK